MVGVLLLAGIDSTWKNQLFVKDYDSHNIFQRTVGKNLKSHFSVLLTTISINIQQGLFRSG